ncbi:ribonuclease H family protein [Sporosarcina sp. HYO08]|uniref:ribonuclease H family protein n=1 Tax=Sporosarcina sp. HYO08 TaxID=1759557 RepID=UPI00079B5102|nr:ribonuclease H family protein [Sporosarcina sp. HYO08]KXH81676.1 hypothetical protein AU377_05240 [Sporosarcina sp. HYO08]
MKIRIEWTYKARNGAEAAFYADEMPAAQALMLTEDIERTGRAKHVKLIDRLDNLWTVKELKRYLKEIDTEPHHITVYFDGGFDLESSHAGLGCVIYYEQNGKSYRLRRNAHSTELKSNNEAEYAALYLCLQELELMNVHHLPVLFKGDSQVVINQLTGEWPTLENNLSAWADRIEEKMKEHGIQPEYQLIGRKLNTEADRLATQSLNGVPITATIELAD